MRTRIDPDQMLAEWFASDASAPVPRDGLARVLDATRRRRPRRSWRAWLATIGTRPMDAPPARPFATGGRLALGGTVLLGLVVGATAIAGTIGSPSPMPRPVGQLAFAREGDIYLADPDGQHPNLVADGHTIADPACARFTGPVWAPDGLHFAFRGHWDDQCEGTVTVADAQGRVLTTVPGVGWEIAWAPDGSRFATWVELGRVIGIYRVDGRLEARLPVDHIAAGDFDPAWTPDGLLVVPYGIVVPLDGGPTWRLPAADPRHGSRFAYSPDGRRAAYRGRDGALVVSAADGSDPRLVGPADRRFGRFVWAPDGAHIAAATWAREGDPSGSHGDLRLIEVASGRSDVLMADERGHFTPLRFSPDGHRVLVLRSGTGLWAVDIDGSDACALVVDGEGEWQPAARP